MIIDKEIKETMISQGIEEICVVCMNRFTDLDLYDINGIKTGILRVQDFQDILSKIPKNNNSVPLTPLEISTIRKLIPRDPFGRIFYGTFPEVLENVRFKSLKKNILETRGTKLQKYLLDECKRGEEHSYVPSSLQNLLRKAPFVHSGSLTFREVVSVLFRSSSVNLTRLQIHILLSEIDTNSDREIDYFQLVPVFASALEQLSHPYALADREKIVRAASERTGKSRNVSRVYSVKQLTALSQCILRSAVHLVYDNYTDNSYNNSHYYHGGVRLPKKHHSQNANSLNSIVQNAVLGMTGNIGSVKEKETEMPKVRDTHSHSHKSVSGSGPGSGTGAVSRRGSGTGFVSRRGSGVASGNVTGRTRGSGGGGGGGGGGVVETEVEGGSGSELRARSLSGSGTLVGPGSGSMSGSGRGLGSVSGTVSGGGAVSGSGTGSCRGSGWESRGHWWACDSVKER